MSIFHALLFNVNTKISNGRNAGIHRIATHLRDQNWDVEAIDFTCFWTLEQLKLLCSMRITDNTKFIGFSHPFSNWNDELDRFTFWIKKTYPDILIISGSSNPPLFKSTSIDYFVAGYGEKALDCLLNYKFSNGAPPKYTTIPDGRKIIYAIHDYPAYPHKSPTIFYEERDFIHENEFVPIEISRGCRFSCAFCNFPILGVKGDYTRDADNFEKQLIHAYDNWGVTNYMTNDETFNDYTEKITKFADAVERLPFRPWFTGYIRGDLLATRKQDQEELLRMNYCGHFYGIETFNKTAGRHVGKGMDPDKLKEGLIDCKNYFTKYGFYRACISIIFGLPYEPLDSMRETGKWLLENWKDQSAQLHPLDIYKDDLVKDSKISADYEKYGYRKLGVLSEKTNNMLDLLNTNEVLIYAGNHIIWENDFTNYHEVTELALNLTEHFRLLDNFSLSHLTVDSKGKVYNFEEKKKLTIDDTYPMFEYNQIFIDNYISKKLNYKG